MAHLHEVKDTDPHFKILPEEDMAIAPTGEVKALKQGDIRSERYSFSMPRRIEGHDMSKCNKVEIQYINIQIDRATRKTTINSSFYEVKDFRVSESEDTVVWSWLVDGDATLLDGTLNFCVRFACLDGDKIEYQKFTDTYAGIPVGKTIWNTEAMAKEYTDVLEAWRQELLEAIGSGSAVKTVNGIAPDENGNVEITVPDSGGNVDYVGVEPAYDDIPKIFFGGALQQTKDEAVVPFRYISKTDDFSGYAEIKAQGNSSMSYPKKNQTVKMFKDEACDSKMKVDFKGWGKQNKHVYKANWIDLTHARNVVSARLWADVVKSRANYADLPELLRTSPNQGAVDGFPVKVYAAGVYQGRYTLNIPKDKWTFNMDDELDEHCVLCGENYVSGCFRAAANINGNDWTDEIHDAAPASIKTRWNQVIGFVMNSTDEELRANLSQYFYIDSLIDYYLFGLASCGLDAFGKNQIYMTYDGQKWIASMYDMDSTWGLYWNGSKFVATDYARTSYEDMVNGRQGNLLYMRLEQLFWSELQTRWAELKNGALSIENIINRFERFTDIAPAELVKEDYASTTGGGKFTGIPSKDTNNIQQIRAFALARHAWTDTYVAGLTPEVQIPCTGISLDKNTLTFTGEGTQTITATVTPDGCTDKTTWVSNNTSVASVNDGVVTAIANGNAIITAKCGDYSASCSVVVSGIIEPVPCTGITLSKTVLTFDGDGTQILTATVEPSDTTDVISWISDNESVVTVENGIVTAVSNGSATITAICGECSASCAVSVSGIEIYTTLEYIESSGTQYIDTGISGNTNAAWEIQMNSLATAATMWEQYFAGSKPSTVPNLGDITPNTYLDGIGSSCVSGTSNVLCPREDAVHIFRYDGTNAVYVDGTAKTPLANDPTGNGWGDLTWYVFNSHAEPNLKSSMRLYYLKMWTDGVLVRDFIPVKRKADNVLCLFDKVTNTFFENIGTGAFTGT